MDDFKAIKAQVKLYEEERKEREKEEIGFMERRRELTEHKEFKMSWYNQQKKP